jgi:hypothetical protein
VNLAGILVLTSLMFSLHVTVAGMGTPNVRIANCDEKMAVAGKIISLNEYMRLHGMGECGKPQPLKPPMSEVKP